MIAVMGVTGAGKSTLINHLVDEDVAIGHNLASCEEEPEQVLVDGVSFVT